MVHNVNNTRRVGGYCTKCTFECKTQNLVWSQHYIVQGVELPTILTPTIQHLYVKDFPLNLRNVFWTFGGSNLNILEDIQFWKFQHYGFPLFKLYFPSVGGANWYQGSTSFAWDWKSVPQKNKITLKMLIEFYGNILSPTPISRTQNK
jgi:hypothetical protein